MSRTYETSVKSEYCCQIIKRARQSFLMAEYLKKELPLDRVLQDVDIAMKVYRNNHGQCRRRACLDVWDECTMGQSGSVYLFI